MTTNKKSFEVHQFSVPVEIDSITCFDDKVFLGTRNGHLLTYLVKNSPKIELKLLKHDHYFSSQPIVQIDNAPLSDYVLLFSLSNNVIKIHKIDVKSDSNVYSSYEMVHVCSQASGATIFATNKTGQIENSFVQFCVINDKKMHLFKWNGSLNSNRNFVELGSEPKKIEWYKSRILIGFSTGFAIYDVSSRLLYIT